MNFIQTKDDLIRKLEKDHDRAEDALFSLLPREKRSALEVRFHDLPPINQKLGEAEDSVCVALFGAWKRHALEKVLATATILPPERLYNGERAYCPLCGNGPDSTFDNYEGYAVPVGLALHLLGRGKGHECAVFRVARARAQRGIEREVNKAVERRRRAAMPKKPNATAGGIAFFRASFRQESRFALGPS